jgi:hypothetical protein
MVADPNAWKTSYIWNASSRVGARITANNLDGRCKSACKIGIANAPGDYYYFLIVISC